MERGDIIMIDSSYIEDSKVLGSAAVACVLDYAQIFNQIITLIISICTLIYVVARAYQTIKNIKPHKIKRKRRC